MWTQRRCIQRRIRRSQVGAAITEFLIVGPVAIFFTFLIIQSGMLYMAKLTLNNATFMAARDGATKNVSYNNDNPIRLSLAKGLIPFYQNSLNTDDSKRLGDALIKATVDVQATGHVPGMGAHIEVLSPSADAFKAYGITDGKTTYIPNDNLEFRTATPMNGANLSIQDANILRIKVTYAYPLKVPLMAAIIKRIMCPLAGSSAVTAWNNPGLTPIGDDVDDCAFYMQGNVPIVSYATVQMQSNPQLN